MFICRFFPKVKVGTCYWSQDILNLGHSRWPVCSFDPMTSPQFWPHMTSSRSYEVTFLFASNVWWNRDRSLRMVPMSFSCTDASTDMQYEYDLLDTWPHVTLTWNQFLTWPFKVNMYIFRRVSTSGTRWCQSYAASFLSSKVICEKTVFAKKCYFDNFWPLQPNSLTLAQFWRHVSERALKCLSNDFSAACYL